MTLVGYRSAWRCGATPPGIRPGAGFRSVAGSGCPGSSRAGSTPRPNGRVSRTTTLVDAPFQKPAEQGLTEVEVTDPGHPLFGRRFAVVSVSGPRPPGRAGGHILVAHSSRVLLKLPLAATSLVPRPPDVGLSKLSVEAVVELIALAEDSEGVTCSSGPNASGTAPPRRCGTRSPRTSQPSSRR